MNDEPTPMLGGDGWTCMICGEKRLNSDISVATAVGYWAQRVRVLVTVRYCNDRRGCAFKAMDEAWKAVDRAGTVTPRAESVAPGPGKDHMQ